METYQEQYGSWESWLGRSHPPWQSGRPRGRDPCTESRERDTFIILDGVRKTYSTRSVGRHFNPPVAPWDPQVDPGEYLRQR